MDAAQDREPEAAGGATAEEPVPATPPVTLPEQRSGESPPGPQPAVSPGLWMELLVHGMGGTTPEAMLEDPHLKQMTGDSMSGTYRRWPDQDAEDRPGDYRGEAVLEAYSWAKLTSGAASRAFWLLLLPFMFANLAHWMRPPRPDDRGRSAYQALVKLIAVSLTVLLTAAACEIALDLVAWQCAARSACVAQHSWLVFALGGHGGWLGQPGRRLAVAVLLPVAVLLVLGRLSGLTWSSYEKVRPMRAERTQDEPIEMEGADFWYGVATVQRLRRLHLAAGLLTVSWAALLPVARYDRWAGSGLGWVGVALLVALVVLGSLLLAGLALGEDAVPPRALLLACAAALVLVCGYALWSRPEWVAGGTLPGAQRGFAALAAGQVALVLALAGLTWWMKRDTPTAVPVDPELTIPSPAADAERPANSGFGGGNGPGLRGLAGPVTALLAIGLGGLFSSGSALFVAQRLAGGHGAGPMAVPLLVWHASGVTLLAPVLLAIVGMVALRLVRVSRGLHTPVLDAYDEPAAVDSPRTGAISTALSGARLTESGTTLIGALGGLAAALLLTALVGSLVTGQTLAQATASCGGFLAGFGRSLQNLGGWLTTAMVVGLLALGRSAYNSPSTRRSVGMLWDIGTFWPRAAHPLAPPCYAERAVPDIEARMRAWLAAEPERRLVLSAHSQGTVLAAAAMWQLDPATRRRVALLTYGSPLRRLYGRFFPAYMGPDELGRLLRDVPRWDNLFRITDPVGGPVRLSAADPADDPDQPPFPDPLAFGRSDAYPILVPINGHSDYRVDPRFTEARNALLEHLGRERQEVTDRQ